MQREVTFNENLYLQTVKRLEEAIEAYDAAKRELRAAADEHMKAHDNLVPEIPEVAA